MRLTARPVEISVLRPEGGYSPYEPGLGIEMHQSGQAEPADMVNDALSALLELGGEHIDSRVLRQAAGQLAGAARFALEQGEMPAHTALARTAHGLDDLARSWLGHPDDVVASIEALRP